MLELLKDLLHIKTAFHENEKSSVDWNHLQVFLVLTESWKSCKF